MRPGSTSITSLRRSLAQPCQSTPRSRQWRKIAPGCAGTLGNNRMPRKNVETTCVMRRVPRIHIGDHECNSCEQCIGVTQHPIGSIMIAYSLKIFSSVAERDVLSSVTRHCGASVQTFKMDARLGSRGHGRGSTVTVTGLDGRTGTLLVRHFDPFSDGLLFLFPFSIHNSTNYMTICAASYAILWTMTRVFEGTCVINRLRIRRIHSRT
jgi:hypothetical protein